MGKLLTLFAASFLACFFLSGCLSDESLEPGLDKLAADFRKANQAADIGPMLALYELEGSDERTLSQLKGALQYELGLPIDHIEFEPLSGAPEETINFVHDGVAYGPSLRPQYRMRVIYEGADRFTSLFSIGRDTSGNWRIVSAKPRPEPSF